MSLLVETDRLELIPFTPGDEKRFLQLNTDAHIRRFLWDDEIIDESLAKEIIRKNEAHFRQDKFGIWKVHLQKNEEVIGFVGLWYFFDEAQPQLIYALFEQYTKKGYAQEASSCIINYAFNKFG